ncbi:11656_t:CDS:2 [Ambispora gerdemannii]|uniref:11656_t:CDS:1 n=1 Tax=Ambispora gerdemannii TaxID=144530 RepID=A0A9N8VWJ0_9GLOM|nr:11656_t:CDS:2 [Ambispora gerdemannii]
MERLSGTELLQVAGRLLAENNYKEAVKVFDILVEKLPDVPIPLLSRCTCLIQLEKYNEALKDGLKILELPNGPVMEDIANGCTTIHSVAYMRLAKCYKELEKTSEAESMIKKKNEIEQSIIPNTAKSSLIKDLPPDEPSKSLAEKLRIQGNELYKHSKFKESAAIYSEALKNDPDNVLIHSNRAQALLQLGDLENALWHADTCIRVNPKWAKGYYRRGCILLEKKQYSKAIVALETASNFGSTDKELSKKLKIAKQFRKQQQMSEINSMKNDASNFINLSIIGALVFALVSILFWYFSDQIITGILWSMNFAGQLLVGYLSIDNK